MLARFVCILKIEHQAGFSPVSRDGVSVLIELTLGHLRCRLTTMLIFAVSMQERDSRGGGKRKGRKKKKGGASRPRRGGGGESG